MMIGELFILVLVYVTLTLIQGHRDARNQPKNSAPIVVPENSASPTKDSQTHELIYQLCACAPFFFFFFFFFFKRH